MTFHRRSGILLHVTSLPSTFGVGDLGENARSFVDFLVSSGQTYWQVLPLSPTGFADSPYQAFSAFAGNPLLVDPKLLVEDGLLQPEDLQNTADFPVGRVDYGSVIIYKHGLMEKAFMNFRNKINQEKRDAFEAFCEQQSSWLDDFALFMALKDTHNMRSWHEWDLDMAHRKPEALQSFYRQSQLKIDQQKFFQWLFFLQWGALKGYANERGIRIIGDLPIFVARDSVDVWANTHLFHFNRQLEPTVVAGVSPDYFSRTGQLWGNPLYRWEVLAGRGYDWWIDRFRQAFTLYDAVRIDHFRGFYNYWEVPGGETTAINGRWVAGPRAPLFRAVKKALGEVDIIAEDLGDFDQESRAGVDDLQAEFGFPGMKVLQFAFDEGAKDPFLPHNYVRECVVYTGTHDNDTTVGWYTGTSTVEERQHALRYLDRDGNDIAWNMIHLGWSSVADTAITTVQDLLSLGTETRMNTPATTGAPNWCWRMTSGSLTEQVSIRLRELTELYGRLPE